MSMFTYFGCDTTEIHVHESSRARMFYPDQTFGDCKICLRTLPFSLIVTYMSPIFEAKGISMRLDSGRWLFKDIDIKLEKGNVLVLQGPSGSGYILVEKNASLLSN